MFGLSSFPYDYTAAAVDKTFELGRESGQLYAVQRDNGIPWAEALHNRAFPRPMMEKWEDVRRRRPPGRPVYLALAPLDFDRKGLAGPVEGSSVPREIRGAAFDSSAVKRAYLNYVRRAVAFFQPDYLNLGLEAGELAYRRRSAWPAFTRLMEHVQSRLKGEFPNLQIGISFGLQSLMEPKTAELAKPFIESCDFLGLSFYPYMSHFHEKFGCGPLPPPPDEWRVPLDWVARYANTPIAICETGYSSEDVTLADYGISLRGSQNLQKQYIEELAATARRDGYLFVVYYFAVDLDRLLAQMPDRGGAVRLWRSTGLFNGALEPKPAWATWRQVTKGTVERTVPRTVSGEVGPRIGGETSNSVPLRLEFNSDDALFSAGSADRIRISRKESPDGAPAMEWSLRYFGDDWNWAARKLKGALLTHATRMLVAVKSDRDGPIVIQLKESSGEAFFLTIPVGTSWESFDFALTEFQPDPATVRNGKLDVGRVSEIVLADGGATEGKTGRRTLWFSDWQFR